MICSSGRAIRLTSAIREAHWRGPQNPLIYISDMLKCKAVELVGISVRTVLDVTVSNEVKVNVDSEALAKPQLQDLAGSNYVISLVGAGSDC